MCGMPKVKRASTLYFVLLVPLVSFSSKAHHCYFPPFPVSSSFFRFFSFVQVLGSSAGLLCTSLDFPFLVSPPVFRCPKVVHRKLPRFQFQQSRYLVSSSMVWTSGMAHKLPAEHLCPPFFQLSPIFFSPLHRRPLLPPKRCWFHSPRTAFFSSNNPSARAVGGFSVPLDPSVFG